MATPAPGRHAAAMFLALAAAIVAVYLAPGWSLWASGATVAVSAAIALAVAAGAATTWTGSRHSRLVGVAMLGVASALLLVDAAGLALTPVSPGPPPYALLLAAATAFAAGGTLAGNRGARWLGLGVAAAGAISSGLNLSQWMLAGVPDEFGWTFSMWLLGSLTLLVTLGGRDAAARDRLAAHEEVWKRRDPVVRWMRAATMSAIAATPMLLIYAFVQRGAVESLALPAALLAGYLAAAALLAARGHLAGGLLLAIGGLALVALSVAAAVFSAPGLAVPVAGYYLVFWIPSGALGIGCGISLARNAGRLPARDR